MTSMRRSLLDNLLLEVAAAFSAIFLWVEGWRRCKRHNHYFHKTSRCCVCDWEGHRPDRGR